MRNVHKKQYTYVSNGWHASIPNRMVGIEKGATVVSIGQHPISAVGKTTITKKRSSRGNEKGYHETRLLIAIY